MINPVARSHRHRGRARGAQRDGLGDQQHLPAARHGDGHRGLRSDLHHPVESEWGALTAGTPVAGEGGYRWRTTWPPASPTRWPRRRPTPALDRRRPPRGVRERPQRDLPHRLGAGLLRRALALLLIRSVTSWTEGGGGAGGSVSASPSARVLRVAGPVAAPPHRPQRREQRPCLTEAGTSAEEVGDHGSSTAPWSGFTSPFRSACRRG